MKTINVTNSSRKSVKFIKRYWVEDEHYIASCYVFMKPCVLNNNDCVV